MIIKKIIDITVILLIGANCSFAFCFEDAGKKYGLPTNLIKAVAYQESRFKSDAVNHNKNGTIDIGVMQINSWWKDKIGEDRWEAVSNDPCYNVMMGTWILRDCVNRFGYTWDCLSCYRSGKPLSKLKDPIKKDVLDYIGRIKVYFENF